MSTAHMDAVASAGAMPIVTLGDYQLFSHTMDIIS